MQRRQIFTSIALALGCGAMGSSMTALASESYPSKPIKIVVPYVPGGPVDVMARIIGDSLGKSMKATVLIENRPGAGANIGSAFVAKSPADGYTLLLTPGSTLTINDALYSKLSYSPSKDFAPISVIGDMPLIVTVPNKVPAQNMQEFVRWGQAQSAPIALSSPGNGATPHLAAELFQRVAKVPVMHVPYKGGAESATAIISGHVSGGIETPPSVLPHIQSGKVKALAVAGPTRLDTLPDVPTAAEAGYPGLQIVSWFGLVAPAGTPQPIIDQLYKESRQALQDAAVKERFAKLSIRPVGGTPADFARIAQEDRTKWHKIIADANIRLD